MSTEPIRFLGATVISFNSQLGMGFSESTLNVDLVEDCENGDAFNGQAVGAPVYFSAGAFNFGGVLSSWTASQGGSGQTYNVKIVDPRQLLENAVVIVDSYLGNPIKGLNYYNAYAYYESSVLNGNCTAFGTSRSTERGMPYQMVINALQSMDPTIYAPTGYAYTINFSSFPTGIPDAYRVVGPSVTILQLLQDVCDVLGYNFYVTLLPGNIIDIGLINLRAPPASFNAIITAYDGYATELSYGQELRNEVNKTILFGEKQHYLSPVYKFNHFFGEDNVNGNFIPVVPFNEDECGFMIRKDITLLNLSLLDPLPSNGPYIIHELDIRSAMASQQLWQARAMSQDIGGGGTLNEAIRAHWPEAVTNVAAGMNLIVGGGNGLSATNSIIQNGLPIETVNNPTAPKAKINTPQILDDLEKVWQFVKSLGDTYYGKQFIAPLNQNICYYNTENFQEKQFTDIPTNAGGWVEDGTPIIGLNDPELQMFREDDGRISCFAVFDIDPPNLETESQKVNEIKYSGQYIGDVNTPSNPIV